MSSVKCLLCQSENINLIDSYKYNVLFDKNFLGDMEIYGCDTCALYFCYPMPSNKNLEDYYQNIYRAKGRNLYESNKDFKNINFSIKNRNYEYLSYLSMFIEINKVRKILDFGSHSGDFGYLLKKKFNKMNLFSCEKDNSSLKVLKSRGYDNYPSLDEINIKFDLITCFHSLEHLNNLDIFGKLRNLLSDDGIIFFEVPNCPFDEFFLDRPYDSPHLFFYNKKNFINICKKYSLEAVNLNTTSIKFFEAFKNMSNSQRMYQNWRPGYYEKSSFSLKKILKRFIPNLIFEFRSLINLGQKYNNIDPFLHNEKDQWLLRGILKKKQE